MSNYPGNYKAPPRKKTIMDHPSFKLLAPISSGMRSPPSLMMYVHPNTNKPSNTDGRIVVFTQTPDNDPKKQKIEIKGLTPDDMLTVYTTIEDIASQTKTTEMEVFNNGVPKDYRDKKQGYRDNAKFVVGRDEKGVYMSLISWNAEVPRLKFYFGSATTEVFEYVSSNEKGLKQDEFSARKARAWASGQRILALKEFSEHWKPWTPDGNNNNNKNGGGNNNYSGGGYGGGSTINDDEDPLNDIF